MSSGFDKIISAVWAGSDEVKQIAAASMTAVGVAVSSLRSGTLKVRAKRFPILEPFEGDQAPTSGPWTAERLRDVLRTQLQGERVIVVANREPLIHEWAGEKVSVRHPASGLVTALEPVMRACSGVWVAHGSGSADRESSDRHGRFTISSSESTYLLRRVWLTEEEEQGYYYGFSNEALWPLCHLAHAHPVFRRSDWLQYQKVNQRFADAVLAEADCDDPIVLVQDYHFALVPKMLRKRLPRATILTFWHIPWPNVERLSICPYQTELLDGLLGSSMVAFQTPQHCHNFLDCVDRNVEAVVERQELAVVHQGQRTLVRAYPISIEWPNLWAAVSPDTETCRRAVRERFSLPPQARLVVSVDRLDYTKGLDERMLTIERTLERGSAGGPIAFVQVGAPSRTRIPRYREFGDRIRAQVDRLNGLFGREGYQPVTLIDRHCEPPEVFELYRAADVCYVSSLHDGMNLVAKEFVAARDDEAGVLLLSKFTGASRELREALVVNPYDIEGVADALFAALAMPVVEQRERMRAMRALLADRNVYRWAGRMLVDATRLRRRERFLGRFAPRRRGRARPVHS
jgi:trehalose 6-phosphate synthase